MNKKITLCILSLLMMLILISNVFSITGSIGNARMILRVEKGDTIEKYILVKNVNDVPVDIEVFASGDLEEDVNIEEEAFSLGPNEEKKAYFTIKVKKAGTTETKINVMFKPEEGNGVGLSSTIIVIAKDNGWIADEVDKVDEVINEEEDSEGVSIMAGQVIGDTENEKNPVDIFFIMTAIIFLIFIAVIFIAFTKTKNQKRKTKPKKSVKRDA